MPTGSSACSDKPAIWARGRSGHRVGALALRRSGGAVLALDDGFYLLEFEGGGLECIELVEAHQPRSR